jgi:hypothetical protein
MITGTLIIMNLLEHTATPLLEFYLFIFYKYVLKRKKIAVRQRCARVVCQLFLLDE